MASSAFKQLQEAGERAGQHVVYAPPGMVPTWQGTYDTELLKSTKAALDAGCSAEKVLWLLHKAATELDQLPLKYLALCVDAGLSPDADMGGESLLHFLLNQPYPPPVKLPNGSEPAAVKHISNQSHIPAAETVSLNELIHRRPTPDLADAAGNTALHMLVACMVQRVHFPDPKLPSLQDNDSSLDEAVLGAEAKAQSSAVQAAAVQQAAAAANGSAEVPQKLQDNDAARAAYAEAAFQLLLDAGWHPGCRNHNGYTVTDLIEAGLSRYQTDLYDLQDPEGVAQTTVALLSERAPDKKLQEFLQAKMAGVQAVVTCLQTIHALAATVERPRKARSAASLVLLWLLLLVCGLYWTYSRRHKGL